MNKNQKLRELMQQKLSINEQIKFLRRRIYKIEKAITKNVKNG